MRIVIIILVVLAVAFAFVAIRGGTGGPSSGDGAPPTKADGKVDEDKLGDWHKPDFAGWLARNTASLAPKLTLANPHIVLAKGASDTRFPPGWRPGLLKPSMRVANVEITGGTALRIAYSCIHKEGRNCDEPVCVCLPGTVTADATDCPSAWVDKHKGRMCVAADDAKTSLAIYPESAPITFTALGDTGATAEVK